MTTYYSAPEPADLQRRCWAISGSEDTGQCRLYNGHDGPHVATPDRADLQPIIDAVSRAHGSLHLADSDGVDRALEDARARLLAIATPDRADP